MGGKQQEFRETVAWLKGLGWRVDTDRKGYPLARSARAGTTTKTIHRTPSDPSYFRNLRAWVERQSCMMEKKEGGQ